MQTHPDSSDDLAVISYWNEIAATWTDTIRKGAIETRELVTNDAVIQAILDRSPQSVLDLGCGEGWLCRELSQHGVRATGLDAVPDLIAQATARGGGDFRIATYQEISAGEVKLSADVVVCNFSLLGKQSVENVVGRIPSLLERDGALVVQTLHPLVACGDEPYQDGWRLSPWTGISTAFSNPSPWYFRTFESWIRLFSGSGLRLLEVREPIHPRTGRPASVIFVADATPKSQSLAET